MRKYIFLFFVASFFIFCFLYGFQKQKELTQPEKYEVEVRLVLVDVIVKKGGEFVTDLKKEDFELYEDGKKVPINSFELISFAERREVAFEEKPEEEIPPSRPSKKLTVIFDGVNSWSRHLKRGAKKIFEELNSLAKLGHEVMIIQMSEKKGVEILQPFTINEALISKAVEKAAGNIWVDKSLDALKLAQDVGVEGAGEQTQVSRSIDETDLSATLLEEYLHSEKYRFEISVGEILAVFNMIKDMPGRKSILLISDGFADLSSKTLESLITATTPSGTSSKARSPHLDMRRKPGVIRVFDPFNILKRKKFVSGEEVIRELIQYANAQNISLYTLDPGTFSEYFFTATAESFPQASIFKGQEKIKRIQNLRWISEDTGAAWLRGAKKYERFRKVMKIDLNYYYQLSYYPPRKEPDNKYHKIKVKVKRSGMNVRFRKGYTDYTEEEEEKIRLVSALYNPSLFTELPFEAEFIPFHKDLNRYEPWMNIAFPVNKLFIEKGIVHGPKLFNLHVWIKDKKWGEKAFGGQVTIPFNIDSSFTDVIKTTDYLCFYHKGPELAFSQKEYQAIFALSDPQTDEIGTWEATLSLPDFKEKKQGSLINCVLGYLSLNPKKGKKSFSLSQKDGSLEYGEIKFFPSVTNQFHRMQNASVFLQAYLPQGKINFQPKFEVSGKDRLSQTVPKEMVAESWNEKSKVWSALFNLNLRGVIFGDYILKVEIPLSEGAAILSKEVKLKKLRYYL